MKVIKKINFYLFAIFFLVIFSTLPVFSADYDVTISNIRFLYGTGKGPTSSSPNYLATGYYRGYNFPGTVIEVTAQMEKNGSLMPMYGDTVFTISYTDGTNSGSFTVTIQSGQTVGTASIPYDNGTGFLTGWTTSGTTVQWTYTVASVSGSYATGTITANSSESIYWDFGDDPNSVGPPAFPPILATDITVNTTTTSFQLLWNPLDTSATNEDFYEYRIYYREEGSSTYKRWSGTNDITLRGLDYNPAVNPVNDSSKHFASSRKYTTISNLKIFTKYEYYIAAVDVFGNETAAQGPFTVLTQPYSISIILSDGVTQYRDFTNLSTPTVRTFRESNIRVEMYLVTSESQPETVTVWYCLNSAGDIVNTGASPNVINSFPSGTLYSAEAQKLGPNKWVAFLPTSTNGVASNVIAKGNSVKFIVESKFNGVSVFSDLDLSDENPNDDEWNFYIGTATNFSPLPTRILNNVITPENPKAYPSYYLSENGYVTIKIFDIKGRIVATLLDNVFRNGGQNIKEKGWAGKNKAQKNLGPGLYYIHIKAITADKKVILNEFRKIVIAR